MTDPIELSREAYDSFEGQKWNAFIELISGADLDELTPVQRIAHLAWWYSSEVLNGGHGQYFGNKDYFDHAAVMSALSSIGARCQSDILKEALEYYLKAQREMPNDYDEYIVWEKQYEYESQLSIFDKHFSNCTPEIETELLENYLEMNESEFIKWVP